MATKKEIKEILEKKFENKKIVCHCLATGMVINEVIEQDDILACKKCFEFIQCFQFIDDVDSYIFSGGSFANDLIDKMIIIDSGEAEKIKTSYER